MDPRHPRQRRERVRDKAMFQTAVRAALVMVVVACIASSTVFGMLEVINTANLLTESLTTSDSPYLADLTDVCDIVQPMSCDDNLK
jgi:hypothetical protein